MTIGINITEDIRIELGGIREVLIKALETEKIKYDIPFDKANSKGIKETLLAIREYSIEISMEDDIITYIKMGDEEFSHLDTIESIDGNILDHLKKIQEKVISKISIELCNIKIEKIDTKTMNITLIVTNEQGKARLQILRNALGSVYMNTMRMI